MNVLTLHHAWASGARKFVGVGSVCEYPAETPVPFREDHLWNGYPVASNDAYGISKRIMLAQSIAYRKQYGFNAIHLLPINLYGPGDDFDLQSSHVIPALIRKCHAAIAAGQTEVNVWGDGSASREFLYVDDAARAVILAAEQYDDADPINVGTGTEVTIAELTREVAAVTGFRGRFAFDATKPAGQSRRLLDVSKARDLFGFTATTPLREGLEKTYEYFLRSVL
jgi:GDP-L-fucose synthase